MKKTLFLLVFACIGSVLWGQQRYALVIGNGNYNTIERLVNPINDATDVAAKLRTLGYQVELQTNIGNAVMNRVINNFIRNLAQNKENEGFFWYAGHGVQIDGENYLLPVDVDGSDEVALKFSSYPVNRLVESFDKIAGNKVNIVVLDACRNNPFRNTTGRNRSLSRGLSTLSDLPPDLCVIYSTAAGDVADDSVAGRRNSPFTEAFISNMDSNQDIAIVIRSIFRETLRLTNNRQRPYYDGSIINLDHYTLNPRGGQAVQPPQLTPEGIQKYALVIGNGNYTGGGISKLKNPVNDADDMTATLQSLGFTVIKIIDGNLEQMESAIIRFKDQLSISKNSYALFYYAGHSVQSGGVEYLIPIDATITSESHLRTRSVSIQTTIDELSEAKNELCIMVLDGARDNPFDMGGRSSGGGVRMANNFIVMYATGSGSTARDGAGRNGLFTEHFLINLKIPGLELNDIFRRTMGDVIRASENKQNPEILNRFAGTAYLGARP